MSASFDFGYYDHVPAVERPPPLRGKVTTIHHEGFGFLSAGTETFYLSHAMVREFNLEVDSVVRFEPSDPTPGKSKRRAKVLEVISRTSAVIAAADRAPQPPVALTIEQLRQLSTSAPLVLPSIGDAARQSELVAAFLEGLAEGASTGGWPIELMNRANNDVYDNLAEWNQALELALVAAWLRTGVATFDVPAALSTKTWLQLQILRHLKAHEASQAVLRFLWSIAGKMPTIDPARPNARTFSGWLSSELLDHVQLPGSFAWHEIVGASQAARWSLVINKTTSYQNATDPAKSKTLPSTHDFGIFIHHGELSEEESERIRDGLAQSRAIRAAVIAITASTQPANAAGMIVAATVRTLRKNVDVMMSRSVQGDAFFGRSVELSAISDALARSNGVALTGARKAGKSSLAAEYASKLSTRNVSILDFKKLQPFDEVGLARVVGASIGIQADDFDHLAKSLVAKQPLDGPRFLLIDEFGIPFERARRNKVAADGAIALANFLRVAIEERMLRVMVCHPRRALHVDPYLRTSDGEIDNPLLQCFEVITLKGLEREDAARLVVHYSRRSLVTPDEAAVAALVGGSGGFPLIVRAILHSATHDRDRPFELTRDDVERAMQRSVTQTSAFHVVRSCIWNWAAEWARDHLRMALRGEPLPDDDVTAELVLDGILRSNGTLAFPLLAAVGRAYSGELDRRGS